MKSRIAAPYLCGSCNEAMMPINKIEVICIQVHCKNQYKIFRVPTFTLKDTRRKRKPKEC